MWEETNSIGTHGGLLPGDGVRAKSAINDVNCMAVGRYTERRGNRI